MWPHNTSQLYGNENRFSHWNFCVLHESKLVYSRTTELIYGLKSDIYRRLYVHVSLILVFLFFVVFPFLFLFLLFLPGLPACLPVYLCAWPQEQQTLEIWIIRLVYIANFGPGSGCNDFLTVTVCPFSSYFTIELIAKLNLQWFHYIIFGPLIEWFLSQFFFLFVRRTYENSFGFRNFI